MPFYSFFYVQRLGKYIYLRVAMVFLTNVIKICYFALSAWNFLYIELKTKLKRNKSSREIFYSILFYFQWENNNNDDEK